MIEIGKIYQTKEGKEVKITKLFNYPDFSIYKGDNFYDYDDEGKASFVLMHKGRFKSEPNDLIL